MDLVLHRSPWQQCHTWRDPWWSQPVHLITGPDLDIWADMEDEFQKSRVRCKRLERANETLQDDLDRANEEIARLKAENKQPFNERCFARRRTALGDDAQVQ